MGDKYSNKHQKKNPKRTKEQIRKDRIKRNKDKEANKHGKTKISKTTS